MNECNFRCSKKACNTKISLRKNSFFEKSKLKCSQILRLGLLWLSKLSASSIKSLTGHIKPTVTSFMYFYHQLVIDSLDTDDITIGGDGIIVKIDESKFGKRKYHQGHRVEGAWVLGGVERTSERKIFLATVERRDAETLLDVIRTHVLPGSIVYTDM